MLSDVEDKMNNTEIKAEVSVTPGQLYRFNLYHCYCNSTNGVFGILLGVECLLYAIGFNSALGSTNTIVIIGLGIIFLIYNPLSLYVRSKSRYMTNDALKKPMNYLFDDKGFILSQGDVSEDMEWADLYKVVETKECLYFFFTKMHANIVPKEAFGDRIDEIYALVSANISKKANKLKKEHR